MSELFHVAFDYDVVPVGRFGRAGTTALRRGRAAIEIEALASAGLPVAYRVEHRRDLGPGRHLILRHRGKLWWPLADTRFPPEIRTARDFLRELRAGRSDLFVRRSLDRLFLEPEHRRRILRDGYDEALAAVARNAGNLLIVDDGLYAAGGVPLLVEAFGTICIGATGADRAVAARGGALQIKPASGSRGGMDRAICGGLFFVPGYPADHPMLAEARADRWTGFDWFAIETVDGDAIDRLVVRIDAAFRTARAAMNRSILRTRPEGFERLRAQFVEACGPAQDDCLTVARYRALQGFVKLFKPAEPRPVAVSECLKPVLRTLAEAVHSGRFLELAPEALELSEEEEAALVCMI
jgi:hypothetical protein